MPAILKLSNDIAIGIISFDIWALSASRSNALGRILISETRMISGDYVIGLLIVGLLVAVGCAVLTNFSHALDPKVRQRWLISALLASILVYIAPFGIIEPVPPIAAREQSRTAEMRPYVVVIPYQDPRIVEIAPAFLRERFLVQFERAVDGTDAADAKAKAVDRFLSSPAGKQVSTSRRTNTAINDKVIVRDELVLAVPQ